MGVRVKKVSKTKIAVKASKPSEIRTVMRRLGVDPELAKGDKKKVDATRLQPAGSGSTTKSRTSPAKKSTAKKSTAKRSTARKTTARKTTAKRSPAKSSTSSRR